MQYIGKRGDYYFYKSNSTLGLLGALPEVQPDHIIAGGAALAVLMGMVLHKFLKPLIYGENVIDVCGVNPNGFNRFSTYRLHKYAHKLNRSPLDMYMRDDYAKALKYSEFSTTGIDGIIKAVEEYPGSDHYSLLANLRDLFVDNPL